MNPDCFWARVKRGGSGCWNWTGGIGSYGYGRFHEGNGRYRRAHRMAWMLTMGPIPAGMLVCHHCDNPLCCNPSHLFLGTNRDNVSDRHSKGRDARGLRNGAYTHPERRVSFPGEQHPNAKLRTADVVAIRDLAGKGWTQKRLAERFGISMSQIGNIARGEKWCAALAAAQPKEPLKHIVCEDSREHVIRWDGYGAHCSEPACEINIAAQPKEESRG